MKRVLISGLTGMALMATMIVPASAGCSCKVVKSCKSGEYRYVKRYRKVAVTCYKKRVYKVPTTCIETSTCEKMTCYKTKTKMVKSTCYEIEPYMKRVWVDANSVIK